MSKPGRLCKILLLVSGLSFSTATFAQTQPTTKSSPVKPDGDDPGPQAGPGKETAGIVRYFVAYPEACASTEKTPDGLLVLKLKTGQSFVFDDHKVKTNEERLENPDLEDMLQDAYPRELGEEPWVKDFDPGRYRNLAFFQALYGRTEEEVRKNLVKVDFLGGKVTVNGRHGAADALRRIGEDLQTLFAQNPKLAKYSKNLGGTFSWRKVLNSSRMSAHSFGIAIDLDPDLGGYWEWEKSADYSSMTRRAAYPAEIVRVFERHGFIWGGKWWHFDLMHFEYRPELIQPQKLNPDEMARESGLVPANSASNSPRNVPSGNLPPAAARIKPSTLAGLVKGPSPVSKPLLSKWWHYDLMRLEFRSAENGAQSGQRPLDARPGYAMPALDAKIPSLADLVKEPTPVTKAEPPGTPAPKRNDKVKDKAPPAPEVKLSDLVKPPPEKTRGKEK